MDIIAKVKNEPFVIISACKGTADDTARTAQMAAMLAAYEPVKAQGVWQGNSEASFVVFTSDVAEMLKLGALFEQTHVLTSEALIDVRTGESVKVDSIIDGADATAGSAYTVVGNQAFAAVLGE